MDLPLLVNETAEDTKILNVITIIENGRIDNIFHPYRPNRECLTKRFGRVFCNNKIVIPEPMRISILAMLHRKHVAITKIDQAAEAFWWVGMHREIQGNWRIVQVAVP